MKNADTNLTRIEYTEISAKILKWILKTTTKTSRICNKKQEEL